MISAEARESQSQSQVVRVSFGIFKPEEGCDINDAVAHMAQVAGLIRRSHNIDVAILRCLDLSWVAVVAVGRGGGSQDTSGINLPEAAAFTKGLKCAVRIVDTGWFQRSSQQTSKGIPFAQISLGDIVSVRRIYCSWKTQDILSYSCLAILKSYYTNLQGIFSYSFYNSLDGQQIIGLGVWDSIESALAPVKYPHRNPALPYWQQLGVKELMYHVWQVVYVTYTTPARNSRPGFAI